MKVEFKSGDRVIVHKHHVAIDHVKILIESFVGTVVGETVNKNGDVFVFINGSGKKSGERIVAKQYVSLDKSDNNLEYDGKNYKIKCCECGNFRVVKPQHINQVVRCRACQTKRNTKKARHRATNRYEELKNEKTTATANANAATPSPKTKERSKD